MKHRILHFTALLLWAISGVAQDAPPNGGDRLFIPAGSKIVLALMQAISTRNAKVGDPVYAETVLPFFADNHLLVPARTTVLGVVTGVKRAGRGGRRAEIRMNFRSLIFSDGYTVPLSGSVQNTPGADNLSVAGAEGAIQSDSDTGRRLGEGGRNAAHGMWVGSMGGLLFGTSITAMRVGGGAGIVLGMGWALFRRGNDVKLEPGTRIEMAVPSQVALDASRLSDSEINKSGSS
jgi:hypothetical protein